MYIKVNHDQLSAYDWLMLHECYAQSSGANWREFFLELGVTDFLAVKERAITITPTELVRATYYALNSNLLTYLTKLVNKFGSITSNCV